MIKPKMQLLLLLTACVFSGELKGQSWTAPVPAGSTVVSGTGYYVYNVGAKAFLKRGGDWTSQAVVFTGEGSLITPVLASSLWTLQYENSASRLLNCNISSGNVAGSIYTDGTSNDGTNTNTQYNLTGPAVDNSYSIQVRSTYAPYNAIQFVGAASVVETAANGGSAQIYPVRYNIATSDYTKWIFCTSAEVAKYNARVKLDKYMKIAKLVGSAIDLTSYITTYNSGTTTDINTAATTLSTALSPTDKTSTLTNPGFYSGGNNYTGWTATGTTPSANNSEVEYYGKIGGLNQTVSSLPAGIYILKVQGYERPSNLAAIDESWYANGWDSRSSYFYATASGTTTTYPFRSMYSETTSTSSSGTKYTGGTIYYPNTMAQAQTGFTAGLYDNESPYFAVDATGTATIGMNSCFKSNYTKQSQWLVADNFRLYYYGGFAVASVSDLSAFQTKITDYQTICSAAVAGNSPGQYPSSAITAFQTAITTAQGVHDQSNVTYNTVLSATPTLDNAYNTFLSNINQTFFGTGSWSETGKWSAGFIPSTTSNVNLAAAGNLTVNANTTLNSLTIASTAKLTLPSGKSMSVASLALLSDASGTATFVNNGTAVITNANVEQYLPSGRNWYVTTPISNGVVPTGFTYYYYDETQQIADADHWIPVNAGESLVVGKGYIVQPASESVLSYSGVLNDGNYTVNLTRTHGVDKSGFNLVGNPYPSYLSWDDVVKNNVQSSIWYRSRTNKGVYKFMTYNSAGQIGTDLGSTLNVDSIATKNIPPMQAFWVRVNAPVIATNDTTGSLHLTNILRLHKGTQGGNNDAVLRVKQLSDPEIIRLQISNGINADETILYANVSASDNYDIYDSQKMFNNSPTLPELYSINGTEKLAINGVNSFSGIQIPLGFSTLTSGIFTIKAPVISNLNEGVQVYLTDYNEAASPVVTNLSNGSSYTFSSEATNSVNRFVISFNEVLTNYDKINTECIKCYKNEYGFVVVENIDNQMIDKIELLSLDSKELLSVKPTSLVTVLNYKPNTGIYLVRIILRENILTQKIVLD